MATKKTHMDGGCLSEIEKADSGRIYFLIQALGIEIHRYVEKIVDKHVNNMRKYLIATNLYLIAYVLSSE